MVELPPPWSVFVCPPPVNQSFLESLTEAEAPADVTLDQEDVHTARHIKEQTERETLIHKHIHTHIQRETVKVKFVLFNDATGTH